MTGSFILFAFFDNTNPGVAGWLVLLAWFVLFVLILNTIIFFLRRLFRRWRNSRKTGSEARHGEKQA
jgi:threonine/homoserine/homoserine lactone efflux protein